MLVETNKNPLHPVHLLLIIAIKHHTRARIKISVEVQSLDLDKYTSRGSMDREEVNFVAIFEHRKKNFVVK